VIVARAEVCCAVSVAQAGAAALGPVSAMQLVPRTTA